MILTNIAKQTFLTIQECFEFALECNFEFFIFDNSIYQIFDNNYKFTNFYLQNGKLKSNTNSVFPEFILTSLIGEEVIKKSNKPFKSGDKTGLVTGYAINTNSPKKRIAFIIDNDPENLVNVNICKLVI